MNTSTTLIQQKKFLCGFASKKFLTSNSITVLFCMGVNISDIVEKKKRTIQDFKNKKIAVDAHNTLYQFLSIIRQPDGTPLKDEKGRVTSHLAGLLYRTANLVESDIKIVYVFDGKPHELKTKTVDFRRNIREKAKEEWKEALAKGDIEVARKKAQQSSYLTSEMIEEAKQLLTYMGIPIVQAPSEGEAQASYMTKKGDVWATSSQDFDSLLFGAPILIRNLTITGRRKLPRKHVYINVEIEEINSNYSLVKLGITREQLVDIGILVGTDFNEGIRGIGPKTALKLIKKYGCLENIFKEKSFEIEGYEEIRNIFLKPDVTDDYKLSWKMVNEAKVKNFLCNEFGFSENRVGKAIKKLTSFKEKESQKSLEQWF